PPARAYGLACSVGRASAAPPGILWDKISRDPFHTYTRVRIFLLIQMQTQRVFLKLSHSN
ncbi:hypothetical protein, partial [Pseudescherichia sp.]|uniref:hypothetical protein n=1 Tax=Pseudescherichia sp. TaxID=2055881 RepID=UPI00289E8F14